MITKDINIFDLYHKYPQLISVLEAKGMPCSHCMGASLETLEQGVLFHGLKLDEILAEINNILENNKN